MADHLATQIRDAVVTLLTGLPTTAANVFAAREYPLQTANLPGLCIYTEDEEIDPVTMGQGQRRLERLLDLVVEGYVKATGDIDRTLDTIRKEVEGALAADLTIGGKAKKLWPVGSEKEIDTEGEKPVGMARMTFKVEYHTAQNAPDAPLA